MYIESFWVVVSIIWIIYLLWRINTIKNNISGFTEVLDKLIAAQKLRSSNLVNSSIILLDNEIFRKAPKKLVDQYISEYAEYLYSDYKSTYVEYKSYEHSFSPSALKALQPDYKTALNEALQQIDGEKYFLKPYDTDKTCIKKIESILKESSLY